MAKKTIEINPLTGKPWPKRKVIIRNMDGTLWRPKKGGKK